MSDKARPQLSGQSFNKHKLYEVWYYPIKWPCQLICS